MYTDETLGCVDCGREFLFTAGEQIFFAEKGFTNKPNRCLDCRRARKTQGGISTPKRTVEQQYRESFDATCTACGQAARVPFQPSPSKPVYCSTCFSARRAAHA